MRISARYPPTRHQERFLSRARRDDPGLPDCNPWLQILEISNPLALFVTKNFLRRLQTESCNPCNYLSQFVIISFCL